MGRIITSPLPLWTVCSVPSCLCIACEGCSLLLMIQVMGYVDRWQMFSMKHVLGCEGNLNGYRMHKAGVLLCHASWGLLDRSPSDCFKA